MSKYSRRKAPEFIISSEIAAEQVCELLEYYDIDVESLDSDEGNPLEKALDHIARAFRTGALDIERDENGKMLVNQMLANGERLQYREISAKAKLAMEKFKPEAGYSRIYAFMGSLCGLGKGGIEKLEARDLAIVEVLGAVFSNA